MGFSGGDLDVPPLRFFGYAYAFYEALKNVISVSPETTFYLVGNLYVFAHALLRALEKGSPDQMFFAGLDALIFDLIASIFIPVAIAKVAYDTANNILIDLNIHYRVTIYGPALVSLTSIVFLSRPLDNLVHKMMAKTFGAV